MTEMFIQVGALTYRVTSPDEIRTPGPDGAPCFGMSKHGPSEIEVAATMGGEPVAHIVKLDTLLHEVLHTCYFAAGSPLMNDEVEELAVSTLSLRLLEVLRSNPDLVRVLLSDPE